MSRVVLIGLGLIGSEIAQQLEKQKGIALTVIDRKPFFENNTASVRVLVQPQVLQQTSIAHSDWLAKSTQLIIGTVVDITDEQVSVDCNGQIRQVPFDILVIASGSSYSAFKASSGDFNERKAFVEAYADRIKQAQNVLIVGGGPVGIETMGEILHAYPDKKVTLVHREERLLQNIPGPKAHNLLMNFIRSHPNARVLLEDAVEYKGFEEKELPQLERKLYRTKKGEEIEADFLIWAAGIRPLSSFMQEHLADALNAQGFIKVNQHLQVEGHPKIFAVGDVNTADEGGARLAANGPSHLAVVVKNVATAVQHPGQPLPAVYDRSKVYKWPVVTIFGPDRAVAALPLCGGMVNSWGIWKSLKNKMMLKHPPKL